MNHLVTYINKLIIIKKIDISVDSFAFLMVPEAGLEPARYRYRRILSPLRLPISPLGHCSYSIHYMS